MLLFLAAVLLSEFLSREAARKLVVVGGSVLLLVITALSLLARSALVASLRRLNEEGERLRARLWENRFD